MGEDEFEHFLLIRDHPRYWSSRMWHAVQTAKHPSALAEREISKAAMEWLIAQGQIRGEEGKPNDWYHPKGRLFLIRDEVIAVAFKLRWGTKQSIFLT